MNCLYEAVAGVYLRARSRIAPLAEDGVGDAEENLESCRSGLAGREAELARHAEKLAKAAGDKKRQGDLAGARFSLLERKRVVARLEKVRSGIALIDKQLDALQSSALDRQLMESLRLSSEALRKAGVGQGLEEAETVMNDLDDQMREASELTTVLATPLVNSVGGAEEDDIDVDEELGLIERERAGVAAEPAPSAPAQGEKPAVELEVVRPVERAERGRGRALVNTMDF